MRRQATIAELGENGLLARLKHLFAEPAAGVTLGIGDDAALLARLGPQAVLTTDLLLEGVDFERRWATPRDLGHKAAAVNLSDLAAMGAKPRGLLLSLALAGSERVADVLRLVESFAAVGSRFGAPLVGGDLSRTSGPLVISVTAVGEVSGARALRRAQAHLGDVVLVSGALGGAAAGLALLQAGARRPRAPIARQLRPLPRLALGQALATARLVRAAADISDGLARDAMHLVGPELGVELDVDALPLDSGVAAAARALGRSPWAWALAGGEDFELVLAVAPRRVEAVRGLAARLGEPLTAVGRVVATPGLALRGRHAAEARGGGFDHFFRST